MSNVDHSKVILHRSHCHGHPMTQNNSQNQIYSSGINNDYIDQGAPSNEAAHKTKCAQVGSTMTTSIKVRMQSINNIMLICQ
jgi:hypothetical protein